MLQSEKLAVLIFLMLVALIYSYEALLFIRFIFSRLSKHRTNILLTKSAVAVHIIAATGIICYLYGWLIEPYHIEVNVIPIKTSKLTHTTFRIVQISDLHCNKKQRNEQNIIKIVNSLKPDVIVFTGDAVNTPAALALFKYTMQNLKASMAKLAVYGNWETIHWPGLDFYSGTGFKLLNAETVELTKAGQKITISGLSCDNDFAVKKTLQNLSKDTFNLFCYHSPELINDINDFNVDLYLCGHTHGGQIALPFYGALVTLSKYGKKYEAGKYTVGKTLLYVNRGLGLEGRPAPQVRFLARPEITVFDISPQD
jgi:uncharacterized protein